MPTPLPHGAESNNCQARKPATQYKGTSLGTSSPQLIKQTSHLAAIPPSNPAALDQIFHGFHLATSSLTFYDVSINDWDFIMEAIAEDDNHQFNRYKLSYSPLSNQLVATLPTSIHENILKLFFIVQMNWTLRGEGEAGSTEKALGIPDVLVEFHDADGGRLQLWGTKVACSQTQDAAITKLQCYVTCNQHMQAVTLFDILENHCYSPPAESSHQLCPDMDITSLDNLQWLFHHTFESVRDATISYIEELMVEEEEESSALSNNSNITDKSDVDDESNIAEASTISEEIDDSPDPFQLVRTWVPPVSPIDWKKFMAHLWNAAWQTGYTHYSAWHKNLIKRKAEAVEISSRASKRARWS
ncbi:uncharacterized protein EDB91DRAFT_1081563 [Suillus paluster]|uniref:uncharacterized protein n=1 Tax=Suillus paluster TaxID=48578 RepID=UPI001B86E598|nr:uncharacterized protein EDB91DRAFT_1081563 [Suillus paluster]KAG1741751.1 hypothetical protein EDB91DRAFT_1081563 [Suillus paluster]